MFGMPAGIVLDRPTYGHGGTLHLIGGHPGVLHVTRRVPIPEHAYYRMPAGAGVGAQRSPAHPFRAIASGNRTAASWPTGVDTRPSACLDGTELRKHDHLVLRVAGDEDTQGAFTVGRKQQVESPSERGCGFASATSDVGGLLPVSGCQLQGMPASPKPRRGVRLPVS
jgi:hypothetical protein